MVEMRSISACCALQRTATILPPQGQRWAMCCTWAISSSHTTLRGTIEFPHTFRSLGQCWSFSALLHARRVSEPNPSDSGWLRCLQSVWCVVPPGSSPDKSRFTELPGSAHLKAEFGDICKGPTALKGPAWRGHIGCILLLYGVKQLHLRSKDLRSKGGFREGFIPCVDTDTCCLFLGTREPTEQRNAGSELCSCIHETAPNLPKLLLPGHMVHSYIIDCSKRRLHWKCVFYT